MANIPRKPFGQITTTQWLKYYVVAITLHLVVLFAWRVPAFQPKPLREDKQYTIVTLVAPPVSTAQTDPEPLPIPQTATRRRLEAPPRESKPPSPRPLAPVLTETSGTPNIPLGPNGTVRAGSAGGGSGGGEEMWDGHSYEVISAPNGIYWRDAEGAAERRGGYLAIIRSGEQNAFVFKLVDDPIYWQNDPLKDAAIGPWLGGWAVTGLRPWMWIHEMNYPDVMVVSNDNLNYFNWAKGMPDYEVGHATGIHLLFYAEGRNHREATWGNQVAAKFAYAYVVEYGPISVPGEIPPDASGNWNGHYYEAFAVPAGITWSEARYAANARGGYLANIRSAEENAFVFKLVDDPRFWKNNLVNHDAIGPWLGGVFRIGGRGRARGPDSWQSGHRLTGGGFVFSDLMTYFNWAEDQPKAVNATTNNPYAAGLLFYAAVPDNRQPTWAGQDVNKKAYGYVIEYGQNLATLSMPPDPSPQ